MITCIRCGTESHSLLEFNKHRWREHREEELSNLAEARKKSNTGRVKKAHLEGEELRAFIDAVGIGRHPIVGPEHLRTQTGPRPSIAPKSLEEEVQELAQRLANILGVIYLKRICYWRCGRIGAWVGQNHQRGEHSRRQSPLRRRFALCGEAREC